MKTIVRTDDLERGAVGRIVQLVEARPIAAFFALAFAYSWAVFGLSYAVVGGERLASSRLWHVPFAWGPPIAALVVVRLGHGSVRPWLATVADPRANPARYVLGTGAAFLLTDGPSVVAGLAGVELVVAESLETIAIGFFLTLFLAGSLEEFGWRGFAQPRLQERYDALAAAVFVGIAFGVWHYPWLLLGGAGYGSGGLGVLIGFPVAMVLVSIVFAWLFNGSGGAVPVVMVAHATVNATPIVETAGTVPGWASVLGVLLVIGIVAVPVLAYGRDYLAPRGPEPGVLGGR